MCDKETNQAFFETMAKVLIRSWWLGVGLIFLWFVVFLLTNEWGYNLHSRWFEITKQEYDLLNYYGMAFVKMIIFFFFLIPYLSIRMVFCSKNNAS